MWSLDSYTKMVNGPEKIYGLDWITEFENGTYYHKAEPRHATLAITETSIERMRVNIKNMMSYTYFHDIVPS